MSMSTALIPVGWPNEKSRGGGATNSSGLPNCKIATAMGLTMLAFAFTDDFAVVVIDGCGAVKFSLDTNGACGTSAT